MRGVNDVDFFRSYTMRFVITYPTLISAAAAGTVGQQNKVVVESVGDSCSYKFEVLVNFPVRPRVDLNEFMDPDPACLALGPDWFAAVKDGKSEMALLPSGKYEVTCAANSVTDVYSFKPQHAGRGVKALVESKWSLSLLSGRAARLVDRLAKMKAMCEKLATVRTTSLTKLQMVLPRMELTHVVVERFIHERRDLGIIPAQARVDIDIHPDRVEFMSSHGCFVEIPYSVPVEETLLNFLTATFEDALDGACLEPTPGMGDRADNTVELSAYHGLLGATAVLTCTQGGLVIGRHMFPLQSSPKLRDLAPPPTDARSSTIYDLTDEHLLAAKELCGSVSAIRDLVVNILSPPTRSSAGTSSS